jgi:hypothetical protein
MSDKIVRRLRSYENETGSVSLRMLRDDAASEIVAYRIGMIVAIAANLAMLLAARMGVELWICK